MAVAVVNAVSALWDFVKTASALEKRNSANTDTQPTYTDVELGEQAAYLCQKYIEHRLARSPNLCVVQKFRGKQIWKSKCSDDVLQILCEMCKLLEECHPVLFVNVLEQLNFRINLGILVRDMFNRVCEHIISSGITWARIIALYSFAGALAHDLLQHNDTRFIPNLSRWMAHFTKKHLCLWIRDHGGWEGLVTHFKEEKASFISSVQNWLRGIALPISQLMTTIVEAIPRG